MEFYIIIRIIAGIFGAIRNLCVSTLNFFIGIYNKEKRKQIDYINRGVVERRNSTIDELVSGDTAVRNTVLSGKSTYCRNAFVAKIAQSIHSFGLPVIVLHENDSEIQTSLNREIGSSLVSISENNPIYDPFHNMKHTDITELMFNTASKQYDLKKEDFESYVEVMCDFLLCQRKQITFSNLRYFPHMTFIDDIDSFVKNGHITQAQANVLTTKVSMGQSERNKIISLLNNWFAQSEAIINTQNNGKRCNLLDATMSKAVVCIDIGSNENVLLINDLVSQINMCNKKKIKVAVVIDDLDISDNEMLKRFVTKTSSNTIVVISTNDLNAMCGSDEKLFNKLISNSANIAVFGHTLGESCKQWAESIGTYEKEEETTAYEKGRMQHNVFTLFPGSNSSTTQTFAKKREYIVKPEAINRMQHNEVYYYNNSFNQLIHTFIK